jgi:hemerythrin-like domain-containing protein
MTIYDSQPTPTRRKFVRTLPAVRALALPAGPESLLAQPEKDEEEVSINEDLMREHGILKRVLLAYDEATRRIRAKQDFPASAVTEGATSIRKFIQDYHEKLEEEHLFSRFRKAGKLVDLVDVLLKQHQAGRRLTDRALAASCDNCDNI